MGIRRKANYKTLPSSFSLSHSNRFIWESNRRLMESVNFADNKFSLSALIECFAVVCFRTLFLIGCSWHCSALGYPGLSAELCYSSALGMPSQVTALAGGSPGVMGRKGTCIPESPGSVPQSLLCHPSSVTWESRFIFICFTCIMCKWG